jgi:hypothetical protein
MALLGWAGLAAVQLAAQESKQNAATNDPSRDMIKALEAPGPHASLGEEARVFDRFVGTWDCDFANFDDDGRVKRAQGRVVFGWIVDGRAVQDVWTWFPNGWGGKERGIGTTVRFFDAKLKKWRIVWVLPEARVIQTLIGGAVGDRIVLEGMTDDGASLRWSFNDIRNDSFVWRGEKSRDGGKTWRPTGEYQMRRRSTSALGSEDRSQRTAINRLQTLNKELSTINYFAMQMFFGSVKKRSASSPPSRPTPLCFIPPKGTRKSRTNQQFTQTVPV